MVLPQESVIATPEMIAAAAAATQAWVEKSVVGLGLCPFAAPVLRAGRMRLCVSEQTTAEGLVEDLSRELCALQAADPAQCETTLLVHPWVFEDFLDFNDFQDVCGGLLAELGLEGSLQIASFHPRFQFADTAAEDAENCTNRSPHPTLHLLRESSIAAVVEGGVDTEAIYRTNIATLRALGAAGWRRLWSD